VEFHLGNLEYLVGELELVAVYLGNLDGMMVLTKVLNSDHYWLRLCHYMSSYCCQKSAHQKVSDQQMVLMNAW